MVMSFGNLWESIRKIRYLNWKKYLHSIIVGLGPGIAQGKYFFHCNIQLIKVLGTLNWINILLRHVISVIFYQYKVNNKSISSIKCMSRFTMRCNLPMHLIWSWVVVVHLTLTTCAFVVQYVTVTVNDNVEKIPLHFDIKITLKTTT